MRKLLNKMIRLVLFSILIFSLLSCSAMNRVVNWVMFRNPPEADLSSFFSKLRPRPGNPDSHYLLACYYQERGRHRQAIEEFQKTLIIDPGHVKAHNRMGVSFDRLGDFKSARACYETATKIDPSLDYVWNNLGYSYFLQGNLDEAVAAFGKAIALNGLDKRFHNNLGLAYAEKREFDLAMAEFTLGGDEAKANYLMAQLYLKKGLYQEAKEAYTRALKLNPSSTLFQTGVDTASSLARIFVPTPSLNDESAFQEELKDRRQKEDLNSISDEQAHPKDTVAKVQSDSGEYKKETLPANNPLETPTGSGENKKVDLPVINPRETPRDPSFLLKGVGIEISNGNGVTRMAREVGDFLKGKGLKVVRLTNANHFDYPKTRIFYQQGFDEVAEYVGDQLPALRDVESVKKFDRSNIRIKVLIGKDLIPYHQLFKESDQS